MIIRPYVPSDHGEWRRMRDTLWPGQTLEDMTAWLARVDAAVMVAERPSSGLCGFAEVGERSYADGCVTSPVAYFEGWYVDADVRRQGIGAALVAAVQAWARSRAYHELASDAELANLTSHRAHRGVGFTEVGRAVLYRMVL